MRIQRVSSEAADLHARVDHGLDGYKTGPTLLFAAFAVTDAPGVDALLGRTVCFMCASDPEADALLNLAGTVGAADVEDAR